MVFWRPISSRKHKPKLRKHFLLTLEWGLCLVEFPELKYSQFVAVRGACGRNKYLRMHSPAQANRKKMEIATPLRCNHTFQIGPAWNHFGCVGSLWNAFTSTCPSSRKPEMSSRKLGSKIRFQDRRALRPFLILLSIIIDFLQLWAGLLMEVASPLSYNHRFYTVMGQIIDGNCNTSQL